MTYKENKSQKKMRICELTNFILGGLDLGLEESLFFFRKNILMFYDN